jgi:hypothetical protein
MGGLPQAQYSVHSSANPSASGSKYDPLRYGLKPGKYRVKHFGHSTQWRTREAMVLVGEFLREPFPPALALSNLHHMDTGEIHTDPHMIRPCAFEQQMAGVHGAEAQKLPLSWIEQCADLGESCLPRFAAGIVIFGCVPMTSATVLPWSLSTGVARKEWTIVPACGPAISTAIPAICPLSLMLLAEIT